MIGGTDIVIPAVGDSAALAACARVIQRHWPRAQFEDAVTGEKYHRVGDIPLERVQELLAYPDAQAEAAWDADRPDAPPNSMLYLILAPDSITVVLDDPNTVIAKSILDSLRAALQVSATEGLNPRA